MNITRNNYEEYFLLYTDNELSAEERRAVEQFVLVNPDLESELTLLGQAMLIPDEAVTFTRKKELLQPESGGLTIHAENCESLFVQYADDELSLDVKAAIEQFVYDNPIFEESFELILSLRLVPDMKIRFPDKKLLLRNEEKSRPIVVGWWKMAAAAIVLIIGGLTWLKYPSSMLHSNSMAGKEPKQLPAEKIAASLPALTPSKPNIIVADPVSTKVLELVADNEKARVKKDLPGNKYITATRKVIISKQRLSGAESMIASRTDMLVTPTYPSTVEIIKPGTSTGAIAFNESGRLEQPEKKIAALASIDEAGDSKAPHLINQSTVGQQANENVYLASMPAERKNSLRSLIRKASRFIEKTTNTNPEKRSGIAIGNIEIAFQ